MSSWTDSDSCGASVKAPQVQAGDTLLGSTSGYSVLEVIGEGCFGQVVKCLKLTTNQTEAVKIPKEDAEFIEDSENEVAILKAINVLDPDHANVVKFFEKFEHLGRTCLAFEMLDRSLYDLLQERDWKPLSLKEIRPIAKQLLVALDALKGLGIVHTDIKPDNIMFVDAQCQPHRIKLIDFGAAIQTSNIQLGMELQPTGYRAPEVSLGLPFTEAIDAWGVGCILTFLYLAGNLFDVTCDYQMMKSMFEVLGQPEACLLHAGIYTQYFFIEENAAAGPTWKLMTPEEFTAVNNIKPEQCSSFIKLPSSLDGLVDIYPKGKAAEFEDRRAFVYLIKSLLHLDGNQRISPREALLHPFVTLSHLTDDLLSRTYLNTSQIMMGISPVGASIHRLSNSAPSVAEFHTEHHPSDFKTNLPATWTCNNSPAVQSSDRALFSCNESVAARSTKNNLSRECFEDTQSIGSAGRGLPFLTFSFDDDTSAWSDGRQTSCSYDGDPASGSVAEARPTDSKSTSSASTVRTTNLLKRIQRFFGHIKASFFCCWCPPLEDYFLIVFYILIVPLNCVFVFVFFMSKDHAFNGLIKIY